MGQFWIGAAAWPSVVQYMNYDRTKNAGPIFGKFQRMPTEDELNELQRKGSKRWDLGWVYTVIAGVLNLLVIYDALAGPMFRDPPKLLELEPGRGRNGPPSPPSHPSRFAALSHPRHTVMQLCLPSVFTDLPVLLVVVSLSMPPRARSVDKILHEGFGWDAYAFSGRYRIDAVSPLDYL